jgi:penicillin-binding protein 2
MQTEKTIPQKIIVIGYIIIAAFVLVLLRLWQLQILQGDDFRKTSESNRLRIIKVAAPRGIIFDRNGIPLVKDTPFFTASVISEEFDKNKIATLSKILNMSVDDINERITQKTKRVLEPIRLKEGLSFEEVSFIEARHSDIPGLIIEVDASREYIYGTAAAHIIGYLGKQTPDQIRSPDFKDVPQQAFIGQWGVEKLFDKSLRGIAGQRIIEVDALGRGIRLFHEKPPVKGADLSLSIDISLQKAAEEAFKGKTGALVAMNPESGEILSLVSSPSFDPNKFTKGISYDDWLSIINDKKYPMLNRATQSHYPPGSTFKIITALAALEEGIVDNSTTFKCNGSISYGKWRFGCWKKNGHGSVSLHRALVESCDIYFYEAGKRVGFDKIAEYASMFGLGRETGFPLGNEKKGLIPTTEWKMKTKNAKWFLGETFINSIGQGYVLTTPIQVASMMSVLSNGGTLFKPRILKDAEPIPLGEVEISSKSIDIVRNGLRGVVNETKGTGRRANSEITTVAGKTGTAQVVRIRKDSKEVKEQFRDHAWFAAYAPFDKPEIALSVFIEHGGHGGTSAAPIAKKAIESYMLSLERKTELFNVKN